MLAFRWVMVPARGLFHVRGGPIAIDHRFEELEDAPALAAYDARLIRPGRARTGLEHDRGDRHTVQPALRQLPRAGILGGDTGIPGIPVTRNSIPNIRAPLTAFTGPVSHDAAGQLGIALTVTGIPRIPAGIPHRNPHASKPAYTDAPLSALRHNPQRVVGQSRCKPSRAYRLQAIDQPRQASSK